MVICEISGFSVRPTASDSMLKFRRRKSEATRFNTPGLFSTSAINVYCIIKLLVPLFSQVFGSFGQATRRLGPSDKHHLRARRGTRSLPGLESCAPIRWLYPLHRVWSQAGQGLDVL